MSDPCNCDQSKELLRIGQELAASHHWSMTSLEIALTALQGIKDALGLPSTPEMRLDAIGTLIGLAEANLERLNRG